MLQWLMEAEGDCTAEHLVDMIIGLNYAAIHATTFVCALQSFLTVFIKTYMHALYDLAVHPEYVEPLRQEIETLVAAEGWRYPTLAKMDKLDSFLKESMRYHPISSSIVYMILP